MLPDNTKWKIMRQKFMGDANRSRIYANVRTENVTQREKNGEMPWPQSQPSSNVLR